MQYNFCHYCGGSVTKGSPYDHQTCLSCNTEIFHNSKPCAGAFVICDQKLLLIKRGIEPAYGTWDVPGGFSTPFEIPQETAIREVKEETGLDIEIISLVNTEIDDYGDTGLKTLNFYYLAKSLSKNAIATDDAMEVVWVDYKDIPNEFGFKSVKNSIPYLKALL